MEEILYDEGGEALKEIAQSSCGCSLQCSRPGWMGLWATWCSGRCPCPWQGGWN